MRKKRRAIKDTKTRKVKSIRKRKKRQLIAHSAAGLKPYEWDLYQSISSLLNEAIEARDFEATLYFAEELKKLRRVNTIEEPAIPVVAPHVDVNKEVEFHPGKAQPIKEHLEETQCIGEKQELTGIKKKDRVNIINFTKPLSDLEKRTLAAVLSAQPPRDKKELAARIFSDQPKMRSSTMGVVRSIQALRYSLSKIRQILATHPLHETDGAFLETIKGNVPVLVSEFDAFASAMLVRYGARDTTLQVPEESEGKDAKVTHNKKNGFSRAPLSFSTDWLRLLYTAFFHPHGATLNTAAIAERTGMNTEVVEASVDGALVALKESWENASDKNVHAFIAMVKERWPEKTLNEICESLQ